jgi:hypothetical protein
MDLRSIKKQKLLNGKECNFGSILFFIFTGGKRLMIKITMVGGGALAGVSKLKGLRPFK